MIDAATGWRIVAHNTFFSVLVETCSIGFTLFFGFLCFLAAAVWRMPSFDRAVWGGTTSPSADVSSRETP